MTDRVQQSRVLAHEHLSAALGSLRAAYRELAAHGLRLDLAAEVDDLCWAVSALDPLRVPGGTEVVLHSYGMKKIYVIKALRHVLSLSLREAKQLVESAPVTIAADDSATATQLVQVLNEAGATAYLAGSKSE